MTNTSYLFLQFRRVLLVIYGEEWNINYGVEHRLWSETSTINQPVLCGTVYLQASATAAICE